MSVAEKLTQIAENEQKVYDAGYHKGKAEGGGSYDEGYDAGYDAGYDKGKTEGGGGSYEQGVADGKQAEWSAFWDAFQANGERPDYTNAFRTVAWNKDNFKPKYSFSGILNYAFQGSQIPEINVDVNVTKKSTNVFYNAGELRRIKSINTTASGTYVGWFTNCNKLEDVTFTGEIGNDIDLQYSTLLTADSIRSVIGCLSDSVTNKTLTLSKTAAENAFPNSSEEEIVLPPFPFDYDVIYDLGYDVTDNSNGSFTIESNNAPLDPDEIPSATIALANHLPLSAGKYTVHFNITGTIPDTQSSEPLAVYVNDYGEPCPPNSSLTFEAKDGDTLTLSYWLYGAGYENVVASVSVVRNADDTWPSLVAVKPNWTISLI